MSTINVAELSAPTQQRRILRWPIPVDDQWHEIPAPVLSVACRGDEIDTVQVWTEDTEWRMRVRVVGTGQPWPSGPKAQYLGTALAAKGSLVWHLIGAPS